MRVLALDLSQSVGWCAGDGTPARTQFGTFRMQEHKADLGEMGHVYMDWLADKLTEFEPDLVALESAFMRGSSTYQQFGLGFVTHAIAARRGIARFEVTPTALKQFVTGFGAAGKDPVMLAMRNRGFSVADDHQGDAAAVMLFAIDRKRMEQAESAAPARKTTVVIPRKRQA